MQHSSILPSVHKETSVTLRFYDFAVLISKTTRNGIRVNGINSMEYSPSSETNSHTAGQGIPRLLWSPKVH
jgi:hypothetical protein